MYSAILWCTQTHCESMSYNNITCCKVLRKLDAWNINYCDCMYKASVIFSTSKVVSEEIVDAVPHNDESVVRFLLALPWWAPLHSYEHFLLSALTDVSNGMHANSSQIFLQFKMLIELQWTALRNNRHADPSFSFVFRFCIISILFAAKWYWGLYEQQLFNEWDLSGRWARHFFCCKRRFLKRPFDVQLQR